MKRLLLSMLCSLLSLAAMAQATRPVRGVVFDGDGIPMPGATLTAVGSTDTMTSGVDGTFEIMVSPYTKFIQASKEGYISATVEVDGSYLVFKLLVDKKYAETKAKAEEEARKAAEAEAARLEAERLAAEKAEEARKAAEAKAKADEEKRIAAEKAAAEKAEQARIAAEAKAKADEEKRIAAEKAAAEKAEQARLAAEEKKRIAEEKRIAAEKAAAEKAEQARLAAEAKAKAEEEKRLAAERAAAEKAEQARLAAEQKQQQLSANNAQVDAARLEKMEAQNAQKEAQLAKKQETIAKWKDAKLRGYGSFIDASWAIDSYSLMMSGGLHYIGGYHFNNCIYLGVGAGINLAQTYEWDGQESVLSYNAWNVPVYAHLRTNFVNRRCSPYFALSAGYQISTRREFPMPFEQSVYYKTSSIFVNPQLGINFRINPKNSIYVAVGATIKQRPEVRVEEITATKATFENNLCWAIDLHLGFTF